MVKFDWKKTTEKLPPEPVVTLDELKADDPDLTKGDAVMYFYDNYDI